MYCGQRIAVQRPFRLRDLVCTPGSPPARGWRRRGNGNDGGEEMGITVEEMPPAETFPTPSSRALLQAGRGTQEVSRMAKMPPFNCLKWWGSQSVSSPNGLFFWIPRHHHCLPLGRRGPRGPFKSLRSNHWGSKAFACERFCLHPWVPASAGMTAERKWEWQNEKTGMTKREKA